MMLLAIQELRRVRAIKHQHFQTLLHPFHIAFLGPLTHSSTIHKATPVNMVPNRFPHTRAPTQVLEHRILINLPEAKSPESSATRRSCKKSIGLKSNRGRKPPDYLFISCFGLRTASMRNLIRVSLSPPDLAAWAKSF